ncbi:hypothetical protein IDH57_11775 [Enterococcus faecium]|uniref:hypothetical protein n=1 Tax=Enterococcus faecium TaxID=1352 RepID=UPI001C5B59B7|nr:hypothetical protein [Enterococcus faecium]MBW4142917.1 hypothetical protein [Enterococcus faecium]
MNKLDLKEGQTYICTDTKYRWWTEGKEYKVVLNSQGEPCLVDNGGDMWSAATLCPISTYFKLKTDDSEQKYTPFEVTKVIIKAYQLYDNDSQRLAYIKGYFAK